MERFKKLRLIAPEDGEEEKAKAEGSHGAGSVHVGQEDGSSNQDKPHPLVYKQHENGTLVSTTPRRHVSGNAGRS